MSVSATIVTQPIAATVQAGGTVAASVSTGTAAVSSVGGGIGPQGPSGQAGPLSDVTDVVLSGVADGDVIRRQDNAWRNFREIDLTIDGGNF